MTVPGFDPLDTTRDGTVSEGEIDAALGPRPGSGGFLQTLTRTLLGGPVANAATGMDQREYDRKRQELMDQYKPQSTAEAATSKAQAAAQAAQEAAQSIAGATTGTKSSGYLGVDQMLEQGIARVEVGDDGKPTYWLNTKDGARSPQYRNADPYKALMSMNNKERMQWRKQMWLAGVMEPDSFVGPLNSADLEAMSTVQTEANLTGITWQDAIASRVEMGTRYGRPITDAEIAALDDDVPALIKQYADANGVTVSDDFIARMQYRVRNGSDTPESVLERLRDNYVKPLYPQFEKELDSGMTMQDLAAPYVDRASQMLETQVDFNDPIIQRTLSGRDQAGQPARKSLWEFEDELTNDPRWKFTNNAYDTFGAAVNGMVSEMGL